MINFERLMQKANETECRLLIQFDPKNEGEYWGIKFYPVQDEDGHYYAYNNDLDSAARQLLDELRGFEKW